jgi:hypothetical protein
MKKVNWVFDEGILDRHDEGFGFPRIDEAVKLAGHNLTVVKYEPFTDIIEKDFLKGLIGPTVICGTINFVEQILRSNNLKVYGTCPGLYLNKKILEFSSYASHFGRLMLNDKFQMLPYGELRRRINEDLNDGLRPPHFKSHNLFVRPNVVTKSFAGGVFRFDTIQDNIESLDKYQKIDNEELVIFDYEKEIIAEFRHIICDREIIAQSQYRRDGIVNISPNVDLECQRLVKYLLTLDHEIDNVYVVDTALTEDGPRIVEFNSFSCSGLYACDTNNIVKYVSEQAVREFYGEIF